MLIDAPLKFLGIEGNLASLGPIQGLLATRNQLGIVALLAIITFAIEAATRSVSRGLVIGSLVLGGLCLLLSRSPVALGATVAVAVAAIALALTRRVPAPRRAVVQWATLVAALVLGIVAWVLRSQIITLLSANSELNYRLSLWRGLWALIGVNPLEGWGWGRAVAPRAAAVHLLQGTREPSSAVNAYIDVWFQLGLAGIFIFAVLVGLAFVRSWFSRRSSPQHRLHLARTPARRAHRELSRREFDARRVRLADVRGVLRQGRARAQLAPRPHQLRARGARRASCGYDCAVTNFSRAPGIVLVLAGLASIAIGLDDGSLIPAWASAVAALTALLARRLPTSLSFALATGSFFAGELLMLRVTPTVGFGATVPNTLAWATVAIGVGVFAAVRPATRPLADRRSAILAVSASVAAVVLVATLLLAQVVPGALKLVWSMNGDAVNAMGFTRRMLVDGGIDPVSTPQPTPLPFAMAAANMEGGRTGIIQSLLLEHDVARTAQAWVFAIVLSCLLAGCIVARAAAAARLRWAAPVAAVASTAILSWYVLGVQFEFGFMNSAFAVTLLLCAWLVFSSGSGRAVVVITGLMVTALALLAVWSPLVVCIAGLGVVVLVRDGRSVIRAAPWKLVVAVAVTLLLLGYAATVTLPGFLGQSSALGSDGGFPAIGPASILVITALATLSAALVAQRGAQRDAAGLLAVIAGFSGGLGYLLLQRQGAVFGWGYYPAKFAWTTSILLVVVLTAFAVHLLARSTATAGWRALTTAIVGGVVASLLWGPVLPAAQVPLAGILAGTAFDNHEEAADIVFELAGTENGKDVLWRTTVGDFWPNTWLLQIDLPDGDPLKIYSTVVNLDPDQMCALVRGLGEGVVVHTSDPNAAGDLDAACPNAEYALVEGEY